MAPGPRGGQAGVHGGDQRVLEEILRNRPASTEELIAIRGIGAAFCEKHGDSVLEALAGL